MMKPVNTKQPAPRYFQLSWMVACLGVAIIGVILLIGPFAFSLSEAGFIGFLITFMLFCTTLAYRLVQQRPQLFLSPMPWFLLASGIYFGFGPLIYFFGNEESKMFCHATWLVSLSDLWNVTWLNIIALMLVFGVWWWRTLPMAYVKGRIYSHESMVRVILAFYLIGFPARCITILADCGVLQFTAPGFLGWLANFTSAGLMLLTAVTLRNRGAWLGLWAALLGFDILSAAVTFSKMTLILAVIPVIFGYKLYRPKASIFYWVPVILTVLYLVSTSFVTYARERVLDSNSIMNRMKVARSFFDTEKEVAIADDRQMWWIRLNYANVETFGMHEYDTGSPGDSLMLALIAPIPRILWPDKPAIESGYGFYKKLTGSSTASFGVGYFAEAYWNGGWLAVILCSTAIGWLFGTVTLILAKEQTHGNLWALPLALLWIKSGARVDGWIHTEIAGPAVFTLLFVGLMHYFQEAPSNTNWYHRPRQRGWTRASKELPLGD